MPVKKIYKKKSHFIHFQLKNNVPICLGKITPVALKYLIFTMQNSSGFVVKLMTWQAEFWSITGLARPSFLHVSFIFNVFPFDAKCLFWPKLPFSLQSLISLPF
jgi:hypothetical protein